MVKLYKIGEVKFMKLSFFGDTVLDRAYKIDFEIDEFIFNLETPLSCDGVPAKFKVNICQEKSYIRETFNKTPIAVTLANNHIMDFGEKAFNRTIDILKENGIKYFGAGRREENFNNPLIIEFEGKRIGLLGYSCPSTHAIFGDSRDSGSAKLDVEEVIREIKSLRVRVDFIIIEPHWGIQDISIPKFSDREIAHRLIDAGANLIIGHHAHIIQSYEIYKDRYIFYGIGNFIFPDLDIPTRWNGREFTARRVKKQEIEHRSSIVVTLDSNLNIDFFTVRLENGVVRRAKYKIPTYLPTSEQDFQKRLSIENKKGMIRRFFRNPKLPNINQIRELLKW